ncbi:MAG: carboxymuconolactone decarboxylase family protein [Dehalococcoidia bacterium]|nr:carboxymuconolactone decarboxylase family protein [Dehalococcoidia bacterium]
MTEYYYDTDTRAHRTKLHGLKKDVLESFGAFDKKVFEEGKLSVKTKELIAVAAAHITRCPYCIAGHTRRAKRAGATDEEIAEAIFVAVAMNAGASLAHSSIAMKALEEEK